MTRQKNGIWKLTDVEMNLVSIWAQEAAEQYERLGVYALANDARDQGKAIYEALEAAGLYND